MKSVDLSHPHKLSLFIFAVSGLMILSLWGFVLTTIVVGLVSFYLPDSNGLTPSMYFSFSGVVFLVSLLLIPSCYIAFRRMINHPVGPVKFQPSIILVVISLIVWIISLGAAKMIENHQLASALIMPIVHIFGFGIPVFLILALVLRNSPASDPQNPWLILNYGIIGGTFLSLVAELTLGLVAIVGASLFLSINPDLLNSFPQQFNGTSIPDPDQLQKYMEIIFAKPQTILILILFLSGSTPIIEESLKPLALFTLRKISLTPADGFKYGALSGAGFGLLESLFSAIRVTGSEWTQLALIRIGSDSMHIFASGLVGWGIVSLFWHKDWKRFITNFLIAAGLHGFWNLLAILIGVDQTIPRVSFPYLAWIFPIAPYILVLISLISLVSLWSINRRLFPHIHAESV